MTLRDFIVGSVVVLGGSILLIVFAFLFATHVGRRDD